MQLSVSKKEATSGGNQTRILSLDVMRGLIMILLAAESCLVYVSLSELYPEGIPNAVVSQFFHHPWHGLRFWDLVQPAFMTMAGAALYASYYFRLQKGTSWKENLPHVLKRSLKLFIAGTALHCVYAGTLVWELWNVLTQLSVTTLIAYLIIRKPVWYQLLVSILLILLTELLYRFVLMPGFSEPFVEFKNFGAWFDTVLGQKINSDGWVAINAIPTAAHTIWGVLAGKVLLSAGAASSKIKTLVLGGLVAFLIGYGLDWLGITPIIKRISTSSFVFASGAWVLWILAFLYWFFDVKQWNKFAWVFVVVGMNAIFIYLFFETVGVQWLNKTVAIFVAGPAVFLGASAQIAAVISAFVALLAEWGLCYWLYKRKIFFKI